MPHILWIILKVVDHVYETICYRKKYFFREIQLIDAEFVLNLRLENKRNKYVSKVSDDISKQYDFIENYFLEDKSYYFVICDKRQGNAIGTIRIYDFREDSFCWGSWMILPDALKTAAIESALLIYDFGFFALHYKYAHFDVMKENNSVIRFHQNFGARIVNQSDDNYSFRYDLETYLPVRKKYQRYLP